MVGRGRGRGLLLGGLLVEWVGGSVLAVLRGCMVVVLG